MKSPEEIAREITNILPKDGNPTVDGTKEGMYYDVLHVIQRERDALEDSNFCHEKKNKTLHKLRKENDLIYKKWDADNTRHTEGIKQLRSLLAEAVEALEPFAVPDMEEKLRVKAKRQKDQDNADLMGKIMSHQYTVAYNTLAKLKPMIKK